MSTNPCAHSRDRSDTCSTLEMSHCDSDSNDNTEPYDHNQSFNDTLNSQERAGYIAEHTSDLAIYLSSSKQNNNNHQYTTYQYPSNGHTFHQSSSPTAYPQNDKNSFRSQSSLPHDREHRAKSSFLMKKTSSFLLHDTLVAESKTTKRRQRRYMIWNSMVFLTLGILLFIYSYNRAKKLETRDINEECNGKQQVYLIFSIIPTKNLSTYYFFYGSFGLFISVFYVIFFHIALVICCDRFSMALYVLFFTNIITSMILFYCYIRVRQYFTNLCDYGDLPKNVSIFISVMAIFGIIWKFLPFIIFALEQIIKCLCPYRCCSYQCSKERIYGKWSPLKIRTFVCKSIAVLSAIGFLISTGIAAWYLVENERQRTWTIIGVSLLILKLFDIWVLLCCQNGCDIRSVIALFGIYTRPRNDFQSMRMSFSKSNPNHHLLT